MSLTQGEGDSETSPGPAREQVWPELGGSLKASAPRSERGGLRQAGSLSGPPQGSVCPTRLSECPGHVVWVAFSGSTRSRPHLCAKGTAEESCECEQRAD